MYKTEVDGYIPKAKNMAKKIEEKCNEMEEKGFSLNSVRHHTHQICVTTKINCECYAKKYCYK